MNQISFSGKFLKCLSAVFAGILLAFSGCKSYDQVDFQAEKCKQPPSGNVKITNMKNLRWDFELERVSESIETEPIRVVWMIDGISFAARRVSYQFSHSGDQKVSVVMTNRCFMQTTKETTVKIN